MSLPHLLLGSSQKALALSQELQALGYWVLAIRPPTVAPGTARLRFSLSYDHKKETLEKLVNQISKLCQSKYGLKTT